MKRESHGLTLIEVLVATVILSSLAALSASALRYASDVIERPRGATPDLAALQSYADAFMADDKRLRRLREAPDARLVEFLDEPTPGVRVSISCLRGPEGSDHGWIHFELPGEPGGPGLVRWFEVRVEEPAP